MDQKYYLFFVRDGLPKRNAALGQMVQCANAAANLGYPTVLAFLRRDWQAWNPRRWVDPWHLEAPDAELVDFYNLEKTVRVLRLPMPYPIDQVPGKVFNSSSIAYKYYFPYHLLARTALVHTREWNLVKAAVRQGVPAIYERDHFEYKPYEPEIVNSPAFKLAVVVADSVRDNVLSQGMPADKTIKIHNGFNRLFLKRDPIAVQARRQELLQGRRHLVVYSGTVSRFKGIDLLLEVAQSLPEVQFVLAGGPDSECQAYRQVIRDRQLQNVKLLGFLSQTQVVTLLQSADALAHPHLSGKAANFTSPLKFFEYMAAGRPIVASTIPPLQEFTRARIPVGWCEPDDPGQFAQALQRVLNTYPWRPDGYIQAHDFVQQFSWESRIERILSHIQHPLVPDLGVAPAGGEPVLAGGNQGRDRAFNWV